MHNYQVYIFVVSIFIKLTSQVGEKRLIFAFNHGLLDL